MINPIFLCIETSTHNCSVAVFRGSERLSLVEESSDSYIHGEMLHIFIQRALSDARIEAHNLTAVAVSKGPGSYTGLRIGVSAAKGLCFALQIPLYSVNSLRVLSNGLTKAEIGDADVLSVIDARRMEVYSSVFDSEGTELSETQAEIVEADTFEDRRRTKFVLVGDAQEKLKEVLPIDHYNFTTHIYPSAAHMGSIILKKIEKEQTEDVAYFEPFYLKDFVAGKPKKSPLVQ
ncbi:MAG: tRNA (adenosine(37)-N6)-threonylcarbamoyltransferase complex dimerization subunit type 1 TsaB [Bacteroidetes bacterium]|nr:MAG: tRNA (adenosine(37)-N6)-threonylcarbamoyltransferase complex dimerization subunit type 1 TsaB [Bacteroidota bacterium]